MKTIQVEVRDDREIVDFLDRLVVNGHEEHVQQILRMGESRSFLQNLETAAEKRQKLQQLKAEFCDRPATNTALLFWLALSTWLVAAEQEQGYLPLTDRKDETDAVAIADANKKPAEKNQQGDFFMED